MLQPPVAASEFNVDADGYKGVLDLNIDDNGNITGSMLGSPIQGLANHGRVVFQRIIDASDPSKTQTYEGYKWIDNLAHVLGKIDVSWCYAGTFQSFQGTGASPQHSKSGWFACQTELPSHGYDTVDANGYTGNFDPYTDSNGNITGSLLGSPIFGLNDEGHFVFQRVMDASNRNKDQLYEGYFWREDTAANYFFCGAGTYQAFQGTGATPQSDRFGWYVCHGGGPISR